MDIGAMTVFLYAFRERELILDLFEEFCGARLTYNSMRIGGLPLDIPPGWDKKVLEFCTVMTGKIEEYETLLTHNRIWLERTRGIGIISGPEAADSACGPALRGSACATCARTSLARMTRWSSTFRWTRATHTIGISCVWKSSGSRCGSDAAAGFLRDRSSAVRGSSAAGGRDLPRD
jgi:Ni,Fe-hydrogenase III large subunit